MLRKISFYTFEQTYIVHRRSLTAHRFRSSHLKSSPSALCRTSMSRRSRMSQRTSPINLTSARLVSWWVIRGISRKASNSYKTEHHYRDRVRTKGKKWLYKINLTKFSVSILDNTVLCFTILAIYLQKNSTFFLQLHCMVNEGMVDVTRIITIRRIHAQQKSSFFFFAIHCIAVLE